MESTISFNISELQIFKSTSAATASAVTAKATATAANNTNIDL